MARIPRWMFTAAVAALTGGVAQPALADIAYNLLLKNNLLQKWTGLEVSKSEL